MRAQPCPVHRETEDNCCPNEWLDDRFDRCPGETQAPPASGGGISISWIDQSRFATISLRLSVVVAASLGRRPGRQLHTAAVILQ